MNYAPATSHTAGILLHPVAHGQSSPQNLSNVVILIVSAHFSLHSRLLHRFQVVCLVLDSIHYCPAQVHQSACTGTMDMKIMQLTGCVLFTLFGMRNMNIFWNRAKLF